MKKFLKIGLPLVFILFGASLFILVTYEDCIPNTDQKAIADMSAINTALKMFYLDVGRYPTQEEGLEILSNTEKGSAITGYKNSGYLERQVKDPWGNEYQYSIGEQSSHKFKLWSLGNPPETDGPIVYEPENNRD